MYSFTACRSSAARQAAGGAPGAIGGRPPMRIMDRYLLASFFAAYLICFSSLVGLHVVIDLFSNADEFLEDHPGTLEFLRRAGSYYFLHSFEYFNRLSPIITMIAAMTTLAALHRFNEIVALLSAGIPTRRALAPILGGTLLVIGLGVVNREAVLPRLSELLQRNHEDINAERAVLPAMHMDNEQILYRARSAYREDQHLEHVNITLPMEIVGQLQEIQAPRAEYRRDPETGRMGWLLLSPTPVRVLKENDRVKRLPNGDVFLFSSVSFADLIRTKNWMQFASTRELIEQLQNDQIKNPQSVRILIHNRFMRPLLSILLVLLGIPFVLQWERRNIYRSIAVSMVISMAFYVVEILSGYFAEHGYLDPMLAAWLPVFAFGPAAFSLFHRIGT